MNQKLFNDFKAFCPPYIACGDIDPVYPILRKMHELRGIPAKHDDAIWHTFLYFVWYHLGSAEETLKQYPRHLNQIENLSPRTTGIERRGLRGIVGARKAADLINRVSARVDECNDLNEDDGWNTLFKYRSWKDIFAMVRSWPQCGTWAAYKWCDLLKNVHGYKIEAPDIGYGGGGEHAGPIPGMVSLTEYDWKECAFNIALQEDLYEKCVSEGIPFNGMEQMETALCDFNSMMHGRYYIGHDIDSQMTAIMGIPKSEYWSARTDVFPRKYLGEYNGWAGVRKSLMTHYSRTGKIYF